MSPFRAPTVAYVGHDLESLTDLPRYYGWILERFGSALTGRCVEYGAGLGTVSRRLLPRVETLELVEPSALVARLREDVRAWPDASRVTVVQGRLEEHVAGIAPQSIDCFVLVNVLEHVRDDGVALAAMFRALRPGGHLCVFVPAHRALYSPFDRSVGHFRRYERPELRWLSTAAGFEIVRLEFMDVLGVLPWLLVHRLARRTSMSAGAARLYDRIGVPTTRQLERIWAEGRGGESPPLGKNLVLVARRPEAGPQ